MKHAALLLLLLGLAACDKLGGSYMDTKNAERPVAIPDDKEADWREGGKGAEGTDNEFQVKVDYHSLQTKRDKAFAAQSKEGPPGGEVSDQLTYLWVLREFKTDQQPEVRGEDPFRREYARFALDCKLKKMAGVAVERHDADGDQTSRRDMPAMYWDFQRVNPGTYQEEFLRQACELAAKKANQE